MWLSPRAAELIREMARRSTVPTETRIAEAKAAAESLRSFLYPKQRAFFAPGPSKQRATRKARRAGITTGGCRELIARALEQPGFRATYLATTRAEAIARAWRSDTKSGLVDVLAQHAAPVKHPSLTCYRLGSVEIEVREADLELNFGNGSQIELFGADKVKQYDRKRGGAKHVFWIDEAQAVPALEVLYDSVVIPAFSDFVGECWMTGTPGRDCVGMFYDITKEPSDDEPPLQGWDVHELLSTDNPFFGRIVPVGDTEDEQLIDGLVMYMVIDNTGKPHGPFEGEEEAVKAARDIRWDRTAGEAKRLKGWKGDEPDFIREWMGKWVKTDARFVYPVHAAVKHELLYAPQRLLPNPFVGTDKRFDGHPPWLDFHAAFRDLPRAPRGHRAYQWMYAIGADFGYNPDPFALTVWAFNYDTPDIFEVFSWKQIKVHTDDQGAYMKLLWDAIPSIVSFVGDPAGKRDDFDMWRGRMNLPIEEANKLGKNTLEEFLADDIRRGRVHLRDGSPLHTEMRYLVYLPTKPGKTREVFKHRVVNGVVHGDHCCFGAGTLVETETGPRAIETVRFGEFVHTRKGLRPVTAAGPTGYRDAWRMETDDGRVLVGTADHPILADGRWIPLAELMPGATLISWESTVEQRLSRSTASATDATPTPHIGRRASTSDEPSSRADVLVPSRSMSLSGSTTTAPFLPGITSTTSTTIPSTTTSPISRSSSAQSICESTGTSLSEPRCHATTSTRPEWQQPSGTAHQKVSHGTSNMAVGPWPNASRETSDALSVTTRSEARTPGRGSALTHAEPLTGGTAGSTTQTGRASSAASSSRSIATSSSRVAPTRVRSVARCGVTLPVYNLTVLDVHEYFANGILVSNCDAARYSYNDLQHYLAKQKPTPPPPGTREAYALEEEREQRAIEDADAKLARQLAEGDELVRESNEYGGGYGSDWG
jgi:hypothetical protein